MNEDDEGYDENAAPFVKLDASQYLEENGLTVAQENLQKPIICMKLPLTNRVVWLCPFSLSIHMQMAHNV